MVVVRVFQPTIRGNQRRFFRVNNDGTHCHSVTGVGLAALISATVRQIDGHSVRLQNGPAGRHHNPHFCMRQISENEFREIRQKLEQFGIRVVA